MGRGGAARAVRGGSYAPVRRWTVSRLRERAVEAWGDGSTEPREAPSAEPARALIRENRRRGVDPGPLEAGARWKRERDIPDRVYFGALEAGFVAGPSP